MFSLPSFVEVNRRPLLQFVVSLVLMGTSTVRPTTPGATLVSSPVTRAAYRGLDSSRAVRPPVCGLSYSSAGRGARGAPASSRRSVPWPGPWPLPSRLSVAGLPSALFLFGESTLSSASLGPLVYPRWFRPFHWTPVEFPHGEWTGSSTSSSFQSVSVTKASVFEHETCETYESERGERKWFALKEATSNRDERKGDQATNG